MRGGRARSVGVASFCGGRFQPKRRIISGAFARVAQGLIGNADLGDSAERPRPRQLPRERRRDLVAARRRRNPKHFIIARPRLYRADHIPPRPKETRLSPKRRKFLSFSQKSQFGPAEILVSRSIPLGESRKIGEAQCATVLDP